MSSMRYAVGLLLLVLGQLANSAENDEEQDVVVFTVATSETDGYRRYLKSTEVFGFQENVVTLGLGEEWRGGDVQRTTGGGQKVNLLKNALEEHKNDEEKIIVFTDSYDVIYLADLKQIVEKFREFDARVVFSAEEFCWPDKSLAPEYPSITRGKRFLNSGGFIGYAKDLYAIVTNSEIQDDWDDQLFYTKVYLDPELRDKHRIKLDHKSEIFQNLNGAIKDIELRFIGNDAYIQNTAYSTVPLIVHGNGNSKLLLNSLGNYVAKAWSPEDGCLHCWDKVIELDSSNPETYPKLVVAVFILKATPFLEEFFGKVHNQSYNKGKIHLFIYNSVPYHDQVVQNFLDKHGDEYRSVKQIRPADELSEAEARNLAMDYCLQKECSGYFSIESESHLNNEFTLKLLVEQQRGIVAPLLVRPFKAWSNFWGALTDEGFYARSTDYMQIVENERRGLWNVPFISTCYLVNATLLQDPKTRPSYTEADLDPDMAFAHANRKRDVFMYVSNRLEFGHLINADNYNTSLTNPEMYQIFDNKYDWERRYLHENYSKNFEQNRVHKQPCPDVYWFPIVNLRFTKEFVEIMEAFGQWSDGSNYDPRLSDGYENVPTRDIHMKQVGLERQWLQILRDYVRPLQELVFLGYYHDDPRLENGYEAVPTRDIHMTQVGLDDAWLEFLRVYVNPLQRAAFEGYYDYPPRSLMNFIVRYRPDEQPSLKPHHDSSTYTINIALNQVEVDYEGGGCRFIRYNCSVTGTKPGWMLLHPGRLTHYHEGLRVTRGTRYIMISFVDP